MRAARKGVDGMRVVILTWYFFQPTGGPNMPGKVFATCFLACVRACLRIRDWRQEGKHRET